MLNKTVLLEKFWKIHGADDSIASRSLQEKLNVDRIVARLLELRKILSYEEAKTFSDPN